MIRKLLPIILAVFIYSCFAPEKPEKEVLWDNRVSKGYYHQVRKGDTLTSIARYYSKDVDVLLRINKIDEPSKIKVDSYIFIPTNRYIEYLKKKDKLDKVKIPKYTASKTEQKRFFSFLKKEHRNTSRNDKYTASPKKTVIANNKRLHLSFIWPVRGRIVGKFKQTGDDKNLGIDIAAPKGTRIAAAQSGKVIFTGSNFPGYGNIIIIEHSQNCTTVYGHNDRNLVAANQKIRQGDIIGTVGDSGNGSNSMLHFEIRVDAQAINPLPYLQ